MFKSLQMFRFTRQLEMTALQIEEQLKGNLFTPCGRNDMGRFGWVSPFGAGSPVLVHSIEGHFILKARKETKKVPGRVLKEMLAEEVQKQEEQLGRALKKKEKDGIKEDIISELLPRLFPSAEETYLWIDTTKGYLHVDATSAKKADDVLSLLRKSLGSLPVVPFALNNPVEITLTEWLREGNVPPNFAVASEATFKSAMEDGGDANYKKQDLFSEEIKAVLDADKLVTKLSLCWADRISFSVNDALSLNRISFSEDLKDEVSDSAGEGAAAYLDANFALATGQLTMLVDDMITAFGGLEPAVPA
ncbi:recombination-associated protein RdgC [Aeromonas dhakensis]|uniref:recombination-associated protein RdgC n=1 Tax=Aeromonas dhakensis TaxID=196024 RepID=UPI00398649B5